MVFSAYLALVATLSILEGYSDAYGLFVADTWIILSLITSLCVQRWA